MLKKGELAQSTRNRRELGLATARNRYRLLRNYLSGKKEVPAAILAACASQSALSALSIPDKGIHAVSLNTLKKAADAVIVDGEGGWRELEKVRRGVWDAGQAGRRKRHNGRSRVKSDASSKDAEKDELLDQSNRARAALMRAYSDLMSIARQAATKDPELAQRVKRHLATFGELGFKAVSEDG